jgi:NADPH2:quinone reductase
LTDEELVSLTDAIFTMLKTGQLKLLVNPAYALADVGKAHAGLQGRGTTGKLVLSIGA